MTRWSNLPEMPHFFAETNIFIIFFFLIAEIRPTFVQLRLTSSYQNNIHTRLQYYNRQLITIITINLLRRPSTFVCTIKKRKKKVVFVHSYGSTSSGHSGLFLYVTVVTYSRKRSEFDRRRTAAGPLFHPKSHKHTPVRAMGVKQTHASNIIT